MDQKYLAEIKARLKATEMVRFWEDVPTVIEALVNDDIPTLLAEVERLTVENISQGEYINELADSIDNWRKLVNEKNGKLVQRSKTIATLKKALELMAKHIVAYGNLDTMLCDNIPQSLHIKYQPKNDGNYENEPCEKCIQDYYIQQAQEQEEKK